MMAAALRYGLGRPETFKGLIISVRVLPPPSLFLCHTRLHGGRRGGRNGDRKGGGREGALKGGDNLVQAY